MKNKIEQRKKNRNETKQNKTVQNFISMSFTHTLSMPLMVTYSYVMYGTMWKLWHVCFLGMAFKFQLTFYFNNIMFPIELYKFLSHNFTICFSSFFLFFSFPNFFSFQPNKCCSKSYFLEENHFITIVEWNKCALLYILYVCVCVCVFVCIETFKQSDKVHAQKKLVQILVFMIE